MYDIENLYEAASAQDAVRLLSEHPEAHIIAGGSDVLIKIREGRMAGCSLVSIYGLDELRGVVQRPDGTLAIGALTSFSHVAADPMVRKHIPVLAGAVEQVGGPQIRNIGTIGGNICNGVTSADSASTLMALDAELEILGPSGLRVAPISQHYLAAGKVDLAHDELLTAILIRPEAYRGHYGHYIKYSMRKAMDIATLGCSVVLALDAQKQRVVDLRLAFGVAGPVPMRCRKAERAVAGCPVNAETAALLGRRALEEVQPRTSWRASKEFRMQLVEELSKRAFCKAVELAGGEIDG